MCIFGLFEVKVLVNFSGTEGFPPRRDGRYSYFITLQTRVQGYKTCKCGQADMLALVFLGSETLVGRRECWRDAIVTGAKFQLLYSSYRGGITTSSVF